MSKVSAVNKSLHHLNDDDSIEQVSIPTQKNATTDGKFGPFGLLVLASKNLTEHTAVFFRIDHSIVESFGGEGLACITSRVYPVLAVGEQAHLYAFNNGTKSLSISSLSAWSMKKAQIV
ncbi:putative fructan beta-(2,1)-fructosidase [Helianthus annuus]|nr:putative fructan beta-(2,1)-fructosidase [Helianthus annuus]